MNKTAIASISLLVGGGAGWFLHKMLKDKEYEERMEEEIQSVREAFRKAEKKKAEEKNETDKDAPAEEKPAAEHRDYGSAPKGEAIEKERAEYREVLNRTPYRPETEKTEENLHRMASAVKRPKIIDPALIGTNEEYDEDAVELFYYADGTLCMQDEFGQLKPMSDIEIDQAVGSDFASHFGEYEEDSVVVDNPQYKLYYVILRDLRTYQQMLEETHRS